MSELSRSSIYFLGINRDVLKQIQETNPEIYERFFYPPYVDEFTVDERIIVWFRQPNFSSITPRNPEDVEYLKVVMEEMYKARVPRGTVHIYRQTLTLEQLE